MTATGEAGAARFLRLVRLPVGARREVRSRRRGHATPTAHVGLARLWRLLRLPLAAAPLGAALGIAVSAAAGPQWQVQSTVAFSSSSQDPVLFSSSNASVADRELADATALATSEAVLAPAADRLGTGEDWTTLQDVITVTPSTGSDIITISGTAPSRSRAAARVEAVVASFAQVSRQRVVEAARRTAAAATSGDAPASGAQALSDIAARAGVLASTAEPVRVLSTTAPTQTGPALARDGATGAVLGLLLAAAVLVLLAARPSRVSTSQDAAEIFGLPSGALRDGQVLPGSRSLISDLQRLNGDRREQRLVVVPAGSASSKAAVEVAAALQSTPPGRRPADVPFAAPGPPDGSDAAVAGWVVVTGDPLTTVVSPLLREASAVVLAVGGGAPMREVRTVHRLSGQWERPPDAVIVAG